MSKLELEEYERILEFSNKQLDVLRVNNKIKEELNEFAYSFVTTKELKVIAKALNKIKSHNKALLEETQEEE